MNNNIELNRIKLTISKYFNARWQNTVIIRPEERETLDEIILEMERLELLLCGGAITSVFSGQAISDLDFYMKNPTKQDEVIAFLLKYFPGEGKGVWVKDVPSKNDQWETRSFIPDVPYFKTENAITFKRLHGTSRKIYTAQLITRFSGEPKKIHDDFDFTITQGTYDFAAREFVFGERFLQDIAKKRLVFLGKSHYPICAMYRTKKYQDRGYTLPGSTIMHIALSIVQLEIKTYKQLKEQLMGVDTMFLQGLLGSEKYANDLPVDYGQFLADAFDTLNHSGVTDEVADEIID